MKSAKGLGRSKCLFLMGMFNHEELFLCDFDPDPVSDKNGFLYGYVNKSGDHFHQGDARNGSEKNKP